MEDRYLVDLFLSRDERAITTFSSKYKNRLTQCAYNILGRMEDTEECVNDTLLALWSNIPPEEPSSILAYSLAIIKNLSMKKFRDSHAQKRDQSKNVCLDEIAETLNCDDNVEDTIITSELASDINSFLSTIKEKDRILFVRRYYNLDPLDELAKYFATNEHNITVRLSRIRIALKAYLEKRGYSI